MDETAKLRSTAVAMTHSSSDDHPFHAALPDLPSRFQMPAGFQWGTYTTADGANLRWGHLPAAVPRAECVLVGGFAEFIEKYFETITDLTRRGLSVWCLDWRGQGGSTRPTRHRSRPHRRDFDRDAADLTAFTKSVLPGRLPRILIAHSMGGAIALLGLAQEPGLFTAAVLSAPMLGLYTAPVPGLLARVLAAVGVALGFARDFAPGRGPWVPDPSLTAETSLASHDPDRCRLQQAWFTAQPDLRIDGPTFGWVQSALEVTDQLQDPDLLVNIPVPILMGCPREERFVDPALEDRAAMLLPHCELVSFPTARHELFLERDDIRDAWLSAVDRFLDRIVVPTS